MISNWVSEDDEIALKLYCQIFVGFEKPVIP